MPEANQNDGQASREALHHVGTGLTQLGCGLTCLLTIPILFILGLLFIAWLSGK